MTQAEKDSLWAEAKNLREKEEAESKRLYESMSSADKEEYKNIMSQLKEKNLPESTRNYLLQRLESISGKYI